MDKFRIFGCHGADNRILHSGFQIARNRLEIADAAADLNRQRRQRLRDGLDDAGVDGLACKSAVEIDNMEPPGALFEPSLRHGNGVVREYGAVCHVTLPQAHALAVF